MIESFDALDRLDIAIDGADQVGPGGWLVKGGGRAHTREKVVANAAERFVVIASSDKLVAELTPPVPLELLRFALPSTLRTLCSVRLRGGPLGPDGGVIADWTGPVDDPGALSTRLSSTPGVIDHGLFCPSLASDIVVAHAGGVQHWTARPSGWPADLLIAEDQGTDRRARDGPDLA